MDTEPLSPTPRCSFARSFATGCRHGVAGERSLFLVNAREVPLIDARIRQVELEARSRKAYFGLDHEAGTLWRAWQR